MRANHTSHALASFPVYSLGFVGDDKVVLGGGGGAGRSGIKNKLRLYDISAKTLELLDELELDPDEDAPMTMAVNTQTSELVCGINSSVEKRKAGDNQNCRVYAITKENKISKKQTTSTLTILDPEVDDYQKVTTFSPNNELLAVGSTNNQVSLLSFPSLAPIASPFEIPKDGGDVFDIDFYDDYLVVCGSKVIYFLSWPPAGEKAGASAKAKGKKASKTLDLGTVVGLPSISSLAKGTTCSFRSARTVTTKGKTDVRSTSLFTVVNTTPPRSSRGGSRAAYVCVYHHQEGEDAELKWTLGKTRSVSSKAITVFDVNSSGSLLAYGSSDLSIGILDAKTLVPLVSILNAHEFPSTVLRFNPSSSLLVSGSADNSVRVVEVPAGLGEKSVGGGVMTMIVWVLLALLVVLLAVLLGGRR